MGATNLANIGASFAGDLSSLGSLSPDELARVNLSAQSAALVADATVAVFPLSPSAASGAIVAGMLAATTQTAVLIQDVHNGNYNQVAGDVFGLVADGADVVAGVASFSGFEEVAAVAEGVGALAGLANIAITDRQTIVDGINKIESAISSTTSSALESLGSYLTTASTDFQNAINSSGSAQSASDLTSAGEQTFPTIAGNGYTNSINSNVSDSYAAQTTWKDGNGNQYVLTSQQQTAQLQTSMQGEPSYQTVLGQDPDAVIGAVTAVNAGSGGSISSTTTELYNSANPNLVGQISSQPDSNGDGGSSLRFQTPAESAALNGTSIDPTQVTPNADGGFTFGSPQADPNGLVNQMTVNGSFGLAGLTVTNPTTGAAATIQLDNGSTTTLQEGRSVATDAPNEQAMTTESDGQVTDSVFGQGAAVPAGAANFVDLVGDGTTATVDGTAPVALTASDQAATLDDAGLTVNVSAGLTGETIDGSGATINADGLQQSNVVGSNNNVDLAGNANTGLTLQGTGNSVTGSGDALVLDGSGSSLNVYGADAVYAEANGQTVGMSQTGGAFYLANNSSGDTIYSSGGNIYADGLQQGDVIGSNNDVDLAGSANTGLTLQGTGNNVTGSGDALVLDGSGSSLNVYGADAVYAEGNGQTVGMSGTAGVFYLADNSSGDTIYSNSSTIYAQGLAQTVVDGGYNTVDLYGSDNTGLAFVGPSNTVYGQHDLFVEYGQGSTLQVYGSDAVDLDASYQTVNISGSGSIVRLGNGVTGEAVYATDATIYEGEGDNIDVYGDGDDVYGDASDYNGADQETGNDGGNNDYGVDDGVYYDGGGYYDDGGGEDGGGEDGGFDFVRGASALKSTETDSGLVANFGLSAGQPGAAEAAEKALDQAKTSLHAAGAPAFEDAKWVSQVPGTRPTITWSFATNPGSAADPFSGYLDTQYQAAVEKAIAAWARASGLTFVEVPDSAASDLRIGWGAFDTQSSGVLGYTSYQQTNGAMKPGAIIRLEDPSQDALTKGNRGRLTYSGTGASLYQVVLHEVGHALGLADNGDPASVMYASSSSMNRTLDATDVAGIRQLYGSTSDAQVPMSVGTGPGEFAGVHRLVQAMARFEPEGSASSMAAVAAHAEPAHMLAASLHH